MEFWLENELMHRRFIYELPVLDESHLPDMKKPKSAQVWVQVEDSAHVSILGNPKGLLHLARWLVVLALHDEYIGDHHHLDPEVGYLDGEVEVTIERADRR